MAWSTRKNTVLVLCSEFKRKDNNILIVVDCSLLKVDLVIKISMKTISFPDFLNCRISKNIWMNWYWDYSFFQGINKEKSDKPGGSGSNPGGGASSHPAAGPLAPGVGGPQAGVAGANVGLGHQPGGIAGGIGPGGVGLQQGGLAAGMHAQLLEDQRRARLGTSVNRNIKRTPPRSHSTSFFF